MLYSFVLLAYLPGVLALLFWGKIWRFPIICFTFLGMFVFNAAGSLGVFLDDKLFRIAFDSHAASEQVALLLAFQAVLFYVVCGTYTVLRSDRIVKPLTSSFDIFAVVVSLLVMVFICSIYYSKTGVFLVQLTINGSMNAENSFDFRQKYVYGLSGWPFFNLGFVFIPIFVSNYALVIFLSGYKYRYMIFIVSVSLAFLASFSLGSKGGALGFVLSFGITYISYLGMIGKSPFRLLRSRAFLVFSILAFGSMVAGYFYTTPADLQHVSIASRIVHRIFVAYPETLAAAVDYADKIGALGEAVLPTMRGLLRHQQINLSALLHEYQAGAPGGVSVPFAAEAYIMSGWQSSVLAIPLVFLTVIGVQEVSMRLWHGMVAVSFSAIYSYLALQLSLNGMFSTFYNFMYPGTLVAIGVLTVVFAALHRKCWVGKSVPDELEKGSCVEDVR